MILVRALNEFDMASDIETNGIASKELIYEIVKTYYENGKNSTYSQLNEKEKQQFIKDHIIEYLQTHQKRLEKHYRKKNSQTTDTMKALINNHNPGALILFQKYMSSLQGHLVAGSRTYTNWISASKDIPSIKKYYDAQKVHQIAILKSADSGLIDSDYLITVDVSTKEKQEKNPFLCNKIDCDHVELLAYLSQEYPHIARDFKIDYVIPTSLKSSGLHYAASSSEVCLYEYIPPTHIIGLINALQMDPMKLKIFNFSYYKLDKPTQLRYLQELKRELIKILRKENDPYLLHVMEELYEKNKNIRTLVSKAEPKEKVIDARNKILRLSRTIPNPQITR